MVTATVVCRCVAMRRRDERFVGTLFEVLEAVKSMIPVRWRLTINTLDIIDVMAETPG